MSVNSSSHDSNDSDPEQRQISVVYYNEQNDLHRGRVFIDEHGKLKFDYDRYDVLHIFGVVTHMSVVWTIQIFFICFLVICDHQSFMGPPVVMLLNYLICYLAYKKEWIKVLKFIIVAELLDSLYNWVFGLIIIIQISSIDGDCLSLLDSSTDLALSLGIYLMICFVCQMFFIYVLIRAVKSGYSLYYWTPTKKDGTLMFWCMVTFAFLAIVSTIIALVSCKLQQPLPYKCPKFT